MIFIFSCALSLLQVANPAHEIRNPGITIVELPELTIEGAKYPTIVQAGDVLYVNYFIEKNKITRLEQRRLINGAFTSPTLISANKNLMVNWADRPRFALGHDGSSLVTWLESNGHGYGVKYMFSRESGAAYTEAKWLHQDQEGSEHGFVSLVPLKLGGFFAVWLQGGAFGADSAYQTSLMGLVISADGVPGDEFVLDDKVCDCCDTDAEIFDSGNVVVTFRDRSDDEDRDIYYVRGNPLEPDSFSGAKPISLDEWKPNGCPVNGPAVSARDDQVAVAWFTAKEDTPTVQLALSSDSGDSFSEPIVVASPETNGRVGAAILNAGAVAVSWIDITEVHAKIMLSLFSPQGRLLHTSVVAKTSSSRRSGFPIIESVGDSVFVTWTDVGETPQVKVARLEFELN